MRNYKILLIYLKISNQIKEILFFRKKKKIDHKYL